MPLVESACPGCAWRDWWIRSHAQKLAWGNNVGDRAGTRHFYLRTSHAAAPSKNAVREGPLDVRQMQM